MEYRDIGEYIDALSRNPELAVVSMQMAADFRGVSRAAIDRMVGVRQLREVKIKKTRCVLAYDLIKLAEAFNQQVRIVRDYLEEAAANRNVVFYEQVMKVLGMSRTVPADRTKIGAILGRVSEEELPEAQDTSVGHRASGNRRPHSARAGFPDFGARA